MALPEGQDQRELVITASRILKELGHTGLDDWVKGLGLPDPRVGRGTTLDDRISSLHDYAIGNPELPTVTGRSLAEELIDRAKEIMGRLRGLDARIISPEERQRFTDALVRTGHKQATSANVSPPTISGPKKNPAPEPKNLTFAERLAEFLNDWAAVLVAAGVLVAALTTLFGNLGGAKTNFCGIIAIPVVCEAGPVQKCTAEEYVRGKCHV